MRMSPRNSDKQVTPDLTSGIIKPFRMNLRISRLSVCICRPGANSFTSAFDGAHKDQSVKAARVKHYWGRQSQWLSIYKGVTRRYTYSLVGSNKLMSRTGKLNNSIFRH